ncbi:MAG: MerR family DNA-binding transcriptional regulator [Streptosporangiales bacterium]|nr:MerR family DNA-binding transcriptional regulator [Streptosporangiales bacterium]
MTIGEVLAKLRPEFPDVTISKIRFLESEGLVEPDRTPSGYRKFTYADLERLQYILAAQRDHYLPLRVIREQLDALDGDSPVVSTRGPLPAGVALPGPEKFAERTVTRFSRDDLLTASGLLSDQLDTLEQYGLVAPLHGTVSYDEDALLIARTIAELTAFGIEPRHLRGFRAAADREVGLVEQVLTPMRRSRGSATSDADETGREIAALFVRLHASLVKFRLGPR